MGMSFTRACRKALNPELPLNRRRSALRTACGSMAWFITETAGEKAGASDIYARVAGRVGFARECWTLSQPPDLPDAGQVAAAMAVLVVARFRLLELTHRWQLERVRLKQSGHRFPVRRPFTAAEALATLE